MQRRQELPDEQSNDGQKRGHSSTALTQAARDGDLAAVRQLLDAGADIDSRQQRCTALHLAVIYGRVEVALELIKRGADIQALDVLHHDPLMICATSTGISDNDAARVARVLLEHGADPQAPRGDPELAQHTPLYMAKNRKKTRLAKILRKYGATD
jgi:ankyrin repeat protein